MERFPLRRAWWATPFLAPLAPRGGEVRVGDGAVDVRLGVLGHAHVPLGRITRVSRMTWPWWGGAGVRIGRGMVAFAAASGPAVVLDLDSPVRVRAPFGWSTSRLVLVAERPDHLAAAVAAARALAAGDDPREEEG